MSCNNDTIVAIATGTGGALAVIRLSGPKSISLCDCIFRPASGKPLSAAMGYTLHYGEISSPSSSEVVDDVVVSLFRSPRSYTGEDMVEISCHGSRYIQQAIVHAFITLGARAAREGEFTMRAFLAGKMDLAQAEAVADMISSDSRAAHRIASTQMRGGYSALLSRMRQELVDLSSLLELELDFSEEDVEFADRGQLRDLIKRLQESTDNLIASFSAGNAIKEGISVAIVGSPNVGKSTLLNTLLRDDRAMVSDIPGTTRDVIEETININGIKFRFLDTAGIRSTRDTLERMGIERTMSSLDKADIVMLVTQSEPTAAQTRAKISESLVALNIDADRKAVIVLNKIDKTDDYPRDEKIEGIRVLPVSAKNGTNIDTVLAWLCEGVDIGDTSGNGVIISNTRHLEALLRVQEALRATSDGLDSSIASDLLAQDIREALYHLGTITGEITTDDLLSNIFSKFCIGK